MEERRPTPILQEFPQLNRLPFFSAQNQARLYPFWTANDRHGTL